MALIEAVVEGEGFLLLALAEIEIGHDLHHAEGLLIGELHGLGIMLRRLGGLARLVGEQAELELIERLEAVDGAQRLQRLLGRIEPGELELGPGAEHRLQEALQPLALDIGEIGVGGRIVAGLRPIDGEPDPRHPVQGAGGLQPLGQAEGIAHLALAHHQIVVGAQELDIVRVGGQREAQEIDRGPQIARGLGKAAGQIMAERRGQHVGQGFRCRRGIRRDGKGGQHDSAESGRAGKMPEGESKGKGQGGKLR